MQQFLITASDGTDKDAPERRMRVRPFHLEGARKLKEAGNFVVGGATLDENGNMNGSVMIVQFRSEAELKAWIDQEPYMTGKVWHHLEIRPFKVAEI